MMRDPDTGLPLQIVRSPEGIDLHFGTATASERLVALVYDLTIIAAVFVVCGFLFVFTLGPAAAILLFFVLRHGYFLWFETRGNGATPGKRRFRLRVVRADGGPLTTEILLARNLTREVELFVPLVLLLAPDALFADHEGIVRVVASTWVLLLLFFPLTNAQRLRIGDLLAGTRVVVAPTVLLERDLAHQRPSRSPAQASAAPEAAAAAATPAFVFTREQLGIYGERELTVLEDVLRKARLAGGKETVAAVAGSIARRIGWPDAAGLRGREDHFLAAFYTAQRQHLEQGLLLGKRRHSKVDRGKSVKPPPPDKPRRSPEQPG
jgi:uncharacterized RDD family membrane protein YckC